MVVTPYPDTNHIANFIDAHYTNETRIIMQ